MVEHRPVDDRLFAPRPDRRVLLVALPIWVTFAASTHPADTVFQAPTPIWPGDQLYENYVTVLGSGLEAAGAEPVAIMMLNSPIMALGIALGKIAISVLSVRHRVHSQIPSSRAPLMTRTHSTSRLAPGGPGATGDRTSTFTFVRPGKGPSVWTSDRIANAHADGSDDSLRPQMPVIACPGPGTFPYSGR
jgi:hypothetical protein